jgi:hypothetical protein
MLQSMVKKICLPLLQRDSATTFVSTFLREDATAAWR